LINGIYAFLGNVAFAGSSIIVAMIFLKYTSLESLGVFSSFMAAYMLIGAFKPLTWQAYVKFKSSYSNKDILPSSLRLDLIGISCFFPVFLIGLLLQIFFETPISMLELFCLLIVAPINNIGTVVGYLRANRYFSIFSLLQIIIALIRIVGCVLFFEIEESNPERSIFIFFALVDLCIWFIALLLILVKEKPVLFQINAFKGAGFRKFSWQGTKVTLVDAPVNHLDYLVVLMLLGAEAVGVFELVKRLSSFSGGEDQVSQLSRFSVNLQNQFTKYCFLSFQILQKERHFIEWWHW